MRVSKKPSRAVKGAPPLPPLIDRPVAVQPFDEPILKADLTEGLAALGLEASPLQLQQLLGHLRMIMRWTQVYNLTAIRDPRHMVTHHLLDALAALPALRRQLGQSKGAVSAVRVLDVGSGAGLPAIPWAVLAADLSVTAIDTVAKKAGFMSQVGAELSLPNFRAVHGRVEQLPPEPGFAVVASRAFASLSDFVSWTRHVLAPAGVWMALKGQVPHDEINALPSEVEVFHVEPVAVPGLDAQRCVVWMRPNGPLKVDLS